MLGSTEEDFYVRAMDLARILNISDNEITRLVRGAVMTRVSDPADSRAFLYPIFANINAYILHVRSKKEKLTKRSSPKKRLIQKAQAQRYRVELENAVASGKFIDKQKTIQRLVPIVEAYRNAMLSRADRLERNLGPEEVTERKRFKRSRGPQDLDSMGILNDLFKTLGGGQNGQNGRSQAKKAS